MDPRIQRTRDKVLDAAHTLVRNEGLGAVTYSALAERSGVGRATLYRHWPDLDALFHDLVAARSASSHFEMTGDLSSDLCRALGIMQQRLTGADHAVDLLTMLEKARRDPSTRRLIKTMEKLMPVRRVLDFAIANGRLPADLDPDVSTSLLLGPLLHRSLMGSNSVDTAFIEAVVDSFLHAEDKP